MDCEQELLSEAGVASSSCLEAVAAAKKAGALAAKSSGFSGGVLAFCQEKDAAAIADSLAVSSLLVYSPLSVSKKGMECTKA
jgi:mevalonate kinase